LHAEAEASVVRRIAHHDATAGAACAHPREAFGDDAMLLIGGSLLAAGDGLEMRCRAFVAAARPSRTAATPGEARA
jgi:hypothetical protein